MRSLNLNPVFFEKTKNGERIYDVSSRLAKDRTIYLDCELDQEVSSQIISLLFLLDREDEEKEIDFWISSPGGLVSGCLAIYDMIQRIKAPVRTIGIGEVASAGAVLLASGSVGKRCLMSNTRVMIHQLQSEIGGSNAELEVGARELKRIQECLNEILARHTGHTKTKIKRDIKIDKWFNSQEAIEYGIADRILKPNKKIPELLKHEVKK